MTPISRKKHYHTISKVIKMRFGAVLFLVFLLPAVAFAGVHEDGKKEHALEVCEKQCQKIDQVIVTTTKSFTLSWKDKHDNFEPLMRDLTRVIPNLSLSTVRKENFTDRGWEQYQKYVSKVRVLFKEEMELGYGPSGQFFEGSQEYSPLSKGDFVMFRAAGRLFLSNYDDSKSIGGRALFEMFVDFVPKPRSNSQYSDFLIDSFQLTVFTNSNQNAARTRP